MSTLARTYIYDIDRNNQMFISVLNTLYSDIILTEENKMFTLISKKMTIMTVYIMLAEKSKWCSILYITVYKLFKYLSYTVYYY